MKGPVYVRLSRAASPILFSDDYKVEIGKANILREGDDVTLVACGLMVYHSLEAAKILETNGVNATVVNMATVKPLDTQTLDQVAGATGKVVTVEEHSILGGLGSSVAEYLAESGKAPVHRIGVRDEFGQSGKASDLLKHYKLMPEDIAEETIAFLGKK